MNDLKRITSHPDFWSTFILRSMGNFLVLFSIFMIVKTFYSPVKEELAYFIHSQLGTSYVVSEDARPEIIEKKTKKTQKMLLADLFQTSTVEVITPVDPRFGIVIPKINANATIIRNVDSSDRISYLSALKNGVAHAAGTALPGENGHIFLFAHSTDTIWNVGRYNAIFYLLYKLEKGDEVNLYHDGTRYKYIVTEKRVVNQNEVAYLSRSTPDEFLTLQTCWPPGTTLQRLLVFARPAY